MGYYRAGQLEHVPWWAPGAPDEEEWAADYLARVHSGSDVGFPDLPVGPLPPRRDEMGYYRAGQDAASEYMVSEGMLRHARTRAGSTALATVPAGHILGESADEGFARRRHRMNPMNVRAARRAIRRLTSFAHIARRIYTFTHPARGKSHFKLHRKRKR